MNELGQDRIAGRQVGRLGRSGEQPGGREISG
jgi:hypothetical protein